MTTRMIIGNNNLVSFPFDSELEKIGKGHKIVCRMNKEILEEPAHLARSEAGFFTSRNE